ASDPYGGFRMGLQSFTYRKFETDSVLARCRDLGLSYVELCPEMHMPVTADVATLREYKAKLTKARVIAWAFGTVDFFKDHEANRKVFEFAKAMGVRVITAVPRAESFESLAA